MEEVDCNLCGSSKHDVIYHYEKDRFGLSGDFKLVKCRGCGLMYLNPRPTGTEILKYYPSTYEPYGLAEGKKTSALLQWVQRYGLRRRCRAVAKWKKSGRLLDLGAATGNFLDEMRHYGDWELYGVELNDVAAQWARDRLGLSVFTGELAQASYPNNFFDVVTLWDVLEHLHDPRATLIEIGRILKPKGLLVLQVPNPDSLEARFFGRFWVGWDPPRHLYVFSLKTLKDLLETSGLRLRGAEYFSGGYDTFVKSLEGFLKESPWECNGLLRTIGHLSIVRLLSFPLFFLVRQLRKSPSMVVFAEFC
jgi:SAM-dependent methyltransferase